MITTVQVLLTPTDYRFVNFFDDADDIRKSWGQEYHQKSYVQNLFHSNLHKQAIVSSMSIWKLKVYVTPRS